tara:strand:- start:12522 stop:13001 length:480 start_codon:yes stop_codon:yes gene_type:complete
MPIQHIHELSSVRLREETRALGMDARGPRDELIDNLHNAGVYQMNSHVGTRPEKYKSSKNFPDHENVCIGAGAYMNTRVNKQELIICNAPNTSPLIKGDFVDKTISLNNCLQLRDSFVNADTKGNEGDIRREGSTLYMYRITSVHPGWYPIQFGPVVIV